MIFAILFEDEPAHTHKRAAVMRDHLAFLTRHADTVHAAGPMLTEGGEGAGGLWVVEAESFEAAAALTREDPFHPTGLRRTITVLEWKQVFTGVATAGRPSEPI